LSKRNLELVMSQGQQARDYQRVLPGIEYMATDKFSLALGLNIDLVGKNTDAALTPLLSMVYVF
jgi:hypothetical protein